MKFKNLKYIVILGCAQFSFAQMQPFKLQEVRPTDGIFKGSGCGSKIHFRTQS
jgi:hypothetical protein